MERSKHPRSKASAAILLFLPLVLTACNQQPTPPTGQQVQQQANQDAQRAGQELGQAKDEAKQALDKAKAATQGMVASAKQGWQQGAAPGGQDNRLDLNSATVSQLESLPGVDTKTAHAIVQGRPYAQSRDLVTKGVVSQDEWQQLDGHVRAGAADSAS